MTKENEMPDEIWGWSVDDDMGCWNNAIDHIFDNYNVTKKGV